jgi:hypothetical protein
MAMNLRAEVLTLVEEEQDPDVLAAVRDLLLKSDTDWWVKLGAAEKASVRRGIDQADAGLGVSHNEAMKPYQKWQ